MNEWANPLGFFFFNSCHNQVVLLKHQEPICQPPSLLMVPVTPTLTWPLPPLAFSPRQWRSWGGCSSNCTWYSHSAAGKCARFIRPGRHGEHPFLQVYVQWLSLTWGRTGRTSQTQATPDGIGEAVSLNPVSLLPPHHHLSVFFPGRTKSCIEICVILRRLDKLCTRVNGSL